MTLSPFAYRRARDLGDALAILSQPGALALAGGTDLLPLWRAGVVEPRTVVDLRDLRLDRIDARDGRLLLGAGARLSDVSGPPQVRAAWPGLAAAIEASASSQVRNRATVGGNLLQATRCPYFRSRDLPCNRRAPGSGCGASEGLHRGAAILGTSPQCVASHASDLAVALVALDAQVGIAGLAGEALTPIDRLWRRPSAGDAGGVGLGAGQLVTHVEVPAPAPAGVYVKVRDRASFEFAVVSVAASLTLEGGRVATAALAAGGVGSVPWRLAASETALIGAPADPHAFAAAAALATAGAQALPQNAFKVPLLERTVLRALELAAARAGSHRPC